VAPRFLEKPVYPYISPSHAAITKKIIEEDGKLSSHISEITKLNPPEVMASFKT
jgi:hypothetical protein